MILFYSENENHSRKMVKIKTSLLINLLLFFEN